MFGSALILIHDNHLQHSGTQLKCVNEIMCHAAKKRKKKEIMSMIGEDIESQHFIKNVKEL